MSTSPLKAIHWLADFGKKILISNVVNKKFANKKLVLGGLRTYDHWLTRPVAYQWSYCGLAVSEMLAYLKSKFLPLKKFVKNFYFFYFAKYCLDEFDINFPQYNYGGISLRNYKTDNF